MRPSIATPPSGGERRRRGGGKPPTPRLAPWLLPLKWERLAAALLTAVLLATPAHAATPGTAEHFLQRAERLLGKGPLALFDPDYKRLQREGEAAGTSIRLEREKAEREGRPILYCSPKPRAELGNMEFIRALRAIPGAERQRMSLRSAMLLVLQRKYPCRR